jgi:RNA polymerase-binding transcription factor DksA
VATKKVPAKKDPVKKTAAAPAPKAAANPVAKPAAKPTAKPIAKPIAKTGVSSAPAKGPAVKPAASKAAPVKTPVKAAASKPVNSKPDQKSAAAKSPAAKSNGKAAGVPAPAAAKVAAKPEAKSAGNGSSNGNGNGKAAASNGSKPAANGGKAAPATKSPAPKSNGKVAAPVAAEKGAKAAAAAPASKAAAPATKAAAGATKPAAAPSAPAAKAPAGKTAGGKAKPEPGETPIVPKKGPIDLAQHKSVAEAAAAVANARGGTGEFIIINGRRVRAISTKGITLPKKSKSSATEAAAAPSEQQIREIKTKLGKKELDEYRALLHTKRRQLVGMLSGMEDEALRSSGGNLSNMPVHMADMGSDVYEQDFTLGMAETERAIINEIDAALQRIEDKTFGVCQMTGKPISKARLDAKPWAKYTIEAERIAESSGSR